MSIEFINQIHQRQPWDENLFDPLRSFSIRDPKNAWKDLVALAGHAQFEKLYPVYFKTLLDLVSSSHNADMAYITSSVFQRKFLIKIICTLNLQNHLPCFRP